jgi:hypothetical protein
MRALAFAALQSRALLFLDAGFDLSTDFEDFDAAGGRVFGSLGVQVGL